jgi:hypothetical protein
MSRYLASAVQGFGRRTRLAALMLLAYCASAPDAGPDRPPRPSGLRIWRSKTMSAARRWLSSTSANCSRYNRTRLRSRAAGAV